MKGAQLTFMLGHSGLDELAEEKCFPNGGLVHPGSARTKCKDKTGMCWILIQHRHPPGMKAVKLKGGLCVSEDR